MSTNNPSVLFQSLQALLRPIIRFCLRWSIPIQEFLEAAKSVYVDLSREEMEKRAEKVNISRISVITGLRRREVMRLYREGAIRTNAHGLGTRVIGQWQNNKRFKTRSGKPRVLSFDSEDSEFNRLVQTVSTDVHPGTVLFELERIGAVKRTAQGLKLTQGGYVPKRDTIEGFTLLAQDIDDLMMAVQENILGNSERQHLHITTEYDNISPSDLPAVESWLIKAGKKFHAEARKFLSRFDRDIHPSRGKETGRSRVLIGTFSRTVPPPEGES